MKTPHSPFPGPTAFVGTPGLQVARHPAPTPVQQEVPPPVKAAPPKQTHQQEALIHVRLPDRVEFNQRAREVTGLGPANRHLPASLADIIPPRRGVSNEWLLDTRPPARCKVQASRKGGYVFFVTRQHLPATAFRMGAGKPPRSRLGFRIGEQLPEAPGVYRLLPV